MPTIWLSVNFDFLISRPQRNGSLYFQLVHLSGELTIVCDYLHATWTSNIERQLALAEMQNRPNESCAPNLSRAGVQNASPSQPAAPRQAEVARSTLNLTASASSPD
jgi:hypothetical protein